jgi:hypothetical protein
MKVLSKGKTVLWCSQHEIELNESELPELSDASTKFVIPADAQPRVDLVSRSMAAFSETPVFLVWFNDWTARPSGQRMHVFDRFRLSYGESRPLIHSPGHVFEGSETEDAISLVTLAILFRWDCYVVSPKRSRLLYFSRDEYGLTKGIASELWSAA